MRGRVVVALGAGALAALAVAASSSASSPGERWVPVDFLKTVRQRYPAFVRVTPLGFGAGGRFYWTARESPAVAVANPREYTDGTVQHVFVWEDGRTRDLGSLGQSDNRPIAVNASGQVAVTRSVGPFAGPVGHLHLPPDRAFIWDHGRLAPLGTLGGADSSVTAIDDRGDIVGASETHGSDIRDSHAFIWRKGKMTDLGTLGGRSSQPWALNDASEVVGISQTSSGHAHAFLWKNGKMIDLGTLGGNDSEALGIDSRGDVIGVSQTALSPRGEFSRGFFWRHGKMTDLGVRLNLNSFPSLDIDDGGTVIGTTGPPEAPQGFVWRNGSVALLGPLDGQAANATAIGGGRVVGGTTTSIGEFRANAFVWESGRATVLPGPRLPWAPAVWIDPTGTRIFAASYETAGLRTRMILWTLRG